jgi:hypothetical protein
MGQANVGLGKSGTYLVDFSSADDIWRKLADSPAGGAKLPSPPKRVSDFVPIESGVNLAAVAKARAKSAGFIVSESPRALTPGRGIPLTKVDPDPWTRSDRRLWLAAGTLMGLAALVLTLFAVVSLGGFHGSAPVAVAAAAPEPIAPVAVAIPAPANTTTPAWRPQLPARARTAEAKPVATSKKHVKHHKAGKRIARN